MVEELNECIVFELEDCCCELHFFVRLALYAIYISEIGPYVGIRDTKMLFAFLLPAACSPKEGQ